MSAVISNVLEAQRAIMSRNGPACALRLYPAFEIFPQKGDGCIGLITGPSPRIDWAGGAEGGHCVGWAGDHCLDGCRVQLTILVNTGHRIRLWEVRGRAPPPACAAGGARCQIALASVTVRVGARAAFGHLMSSSLWCEVGLCRLYPQVVQRALDVLSIHPMSDHRVHVGLNNH